jgi:hypothetical protein
MEHDTGRSKKGKDHSAILKAVQETPRKPAAAVVETGRGRRRTRCQRPTIADCLRNGPSGPDGGIISMPSKKPKTRHRKPHKEKIMELEENRLEWYENEDWNY